MAKREAEPAEIVWEDDDEGADGGESGGDFQATAASPLARPGFHLLAARKIEEARERHQLRQALEDFDDYEV